MSTIAYTVGAPQRLGLKAREQRKRQRKGMMATLMLTPMVDMFSLLVIFLLQFFNATPDFQLTRNMVLPPAKSSAELRDAPVVSVTTQEVFVNHTVVGTVNDIIKNPEPFAVALEQLRGDWIAAHPGEAFRGEVNFEAHEDLPSTQVSQLMAVLSTHQYGSMELMTLGN